MTEVLESRQKLERFQKAAEVTRPKTPCKGCGSSQPRFEEPLPPADKKVVLLWWGFKGAIEGLKKSLPLLGFEVTEIHRGMRGWIDRTLDWIAEDEPDLLVTWQRFYAGTPAERIKRLCDSKAIPTIILDFGLWPHYGSAFLDPLGDNAASAIAGQLSNLGELPAHKEAAERALPYLTTIRRVLHTRARAAEKRLGALGLETLPPGFVFLALQRTGDLVLKYDAPRSRQNMQRLMWDVIHEAALSEQFIVAKTHPLDKSLNLNGAELDGANWRILCNQRWERLDKRPPQGNDNDLVFAWLLVNCSHFITVNSTTLYQAMALGKTTSCLGKGWFTGNGVAMECKTIRKTLQGSTVSAQRVQEFLTYLCSRQLTIEEFHDPAKVKDVLVRFYPNLFHKLGKSDVTAILLNYRRSIDETYRSIHEQGIEKIWLWRAEHSGEAFEGPSRFIGCSDNMGNWQRWALAAQAETDYVLYCDDDYTITPAGLRGLLNCARKHPGRVIGLWGWRFLAPYDHYRKRDEFRCHQMKEAEEVDMISPCGLLAPKTAIQEAFGRVAYWQTAQRLFGDYTCDDLPLCLAFAECACGRPLVAPAEAPGIRPTNEQANKSALALQPGRREKLYHSLSAFLEVGWQPYYEQNVLKGVSHAQATG